MREGVLDFLMAPSICVLLPFDFLLVFFSISLLPIIASIKDTVSKIFSRTTFLNDSTWTDIGMEIIADLSMTQVSVSSIKKIWRTISRAFSLQNLPLVVIHFALSEFTKLFIKINVIIRRESLLNSVIHHSHFIVIVKVFTAFAPTWKLELHVAIQLKALHQMSHIFVKEKRSRSHSWREQGLFLGICSLSKK